MDESFDPVAAGAVAVEEPPFDPTAHGAVPVQQPPPPLQQSTSGVGAFFKGLNLASVPLDIVKSLTPALEAPSALKQGYDLLRGVPVEKALPEDYRALVGIEKKPLEERIKTGLDVVTQLAFLKAGVEGIPGFKAPTLAETASPLTGKTADTVEQPGTSGFTARPTENKYDFSFREPPLTETAGIAKPDIAQPVEPVATDVTKTEPIIPPPNEPTGISQPQIAPSEAQSAEQNLTSQFADLNTQGADLQERINAQRAAQPVPADTEATAPVLGKQEPVAPTTASGTGEGQYETTKTEPNVVPTIPSGETRLNWNPLEGENKFNVFDKNVHTKVEQDPTGNVRLRGVVVQEGERGRGAGREFVDNLVNDAAKQFPNAQHVSVWAFPDAEGFWRKVGFEPTGNTAIAGEHTITELRRPLPVSEAPVSTTAKTSQEIPTGSGIQETGGAAPLSTETPANQIRKAVDSYDFDEQHAGHGQLAQDLEQIDNLPKPLAKALEDYQNAVEEDRTLYGERSGEPSVYGDRLYKAATEHAAPETTGEPNAVAPEIPEGAKATVNFKTSSGKLVPKEMDAREAEGIFTKEKSSYQALLNCLGA